MNIPSRVVSVTAPARLHMGFIDPSGTLGRQFGSIGVTLNDISTRLRVSRGDSLSVHGEQSERILKYATTYCQSLRIPANFRIDVDEVIPSHIGLGSGTQLALAVGAGLSAFLERDDSVRDVADLTGRGARSGIGIAAFEKGGLVIDGGRAETTITPPVIFQMPVPDSWAFLLVFDRAGEGLHGQCELDAFAALPQFARESAADLAHQIMMQAMPALIETDLPAFGNVITHLQKQIGDYFAPVQGGSRFTSRSVSKAIEWAGMQGAVGLGQSSWGPTGFCMLDNRDNAERLLGDIAREFSADRSLEFRLVSPRNQGALIDVA